MSLITPDSGLIIWMTLIFGIVFFLLARFGFPMISGSVKARSEKISESLRQADEARAQLASIAQEQQKMMEEARREQAALLREASEARDAMIAEAKAQAGAEAEKIIADARERIASERENAMRDIRRQVAILSMDVAEKVLRKDLSDDQEQIQLIDRLLDEISERKTGNPS